MRQLLLRIFNILILLSFPFTTGDRTTEPVSVTAAVVVPYKDPNFQGSDWFPVDTTAYKNKFYIDHFWPACEVSFTEAASKYDVHFDVEYYTYQTCQVQVAWFSGRVMTDIVRNRSRPVDVFIGPPCAQDVVQAGLISTVYPTILLTGAATLTDKLEQYPNIIRCAYSTFTQWTGMLDMASQYNWTNFGVVYDDTDNARLIWGNSLMIRLTNSNITYIQFTLYRGTDVNTLLESIKKQARIIVVLAPARIREFMIAAKAKNMTNGDYIYFTINSFPNQTILAYNNSENWQHGDQDDEAAKEAYQSLFFWAVRDGSNAPEYANFRAAVKERSLQGPYADPNYEINYFAVTFHDCILALAAGLRNAYNSGFDFRANYTATLNKFVTNTTVPGPSGPMHIGTNGDRNEDFSLYGITNRNTGTYTVVGTFLGSTNAFTMDKQAVIWPGGNNTPPLSEPLCGYNDDSPACRVVVDYTIPIGVGLAVPCGIILAIAGVIYYRRAKAQEKEDQMWIAHWQDLKVIRPGGPSANAHDDGKSDENEENSEPPEHKDSATDGTAHKDDKPGENRAANEADNHTIWAGTADKEAGIKVTINTGLWRKQAVTVRWSKKRRLRLTREIIRQVRDVRTQVHDNLMLFKGACLEDDRILIIYENCAKGCLTDLINDINLKLDWTLRFSLMSDCMKGISYIHNHVLRVHGRLNSMCCYVDSRFMLKVGDYGLNAFFELTLAELWAAKREPDYLTAQLWKAPEHLKAEAQSRYEVISSVSQKGDVYSFGIIIQELILRSKPFSMYAIPEEEIIEAIKMSVNEIHPRFIPKIDETACPAELADLCDHCWAVDPAKRPNMVQVRASLKELGKQLGMGERSNILDTLLQQMEDMELSLQAIVDEKGEMLLDEKNRSDELLYSVLPKEVAEVMKHGEKARAENFEQVSVLHCDVPEYMELAAESSALQMVDLINDLTDYYDAIIGKYDAYKIDTFKENTMIVSGLPRRNGILHSQETARVALNLLFMVRSFRVRHRPTARITIRMGIHAGPVMAGVVGAVVPRYLLFGDTMSVSSQMLTGGEVMRIQLSLMSKTCLDKIGSFELQERGEIFIKGKGAMKTYWLIGEEGNADLDDMRRRFENGLDETESTGVDEDYEDSM